MRSSALLLICAVLCSARGASADVASEAAFFDEMGRRAYAQGQYERALESFQLVQEIAPSPRLLYNIALCADLAGRSDMAFSLYREYLKGDDPDTARRAEAVRRSELLQSKLALVEIETEPPGAVVYVDRKELGQFAVTPATFAVPEGEHQLLVEQPGFIPEQLSVTAKSGQLAKLRAALTPRFGHLVVGVTPAGASLTFTRQGSAVPAALEQGKYRLPIGSYRVVASLPGYLPAESQVLVREDGTARVDLGLVPAPEATGRLLVSTLNVPAEVYLDGKRLAVTPATLEGIAVGEHVLEVRAGKRNDRRKVTIREGRATYVAIDLGSPAR